MRTRIQAAVRSRVQRFLARVEPGFQVVKQRPAARGYWRSPCGVPPGDACGADAQGLIELDHAGSSPSAGKAQYARWPPSARRLDTVIDGVFEQRAAASAAAPATIRGHVDASSQSTLQALAQPQLFKIEVLTAKARSRRRAAAAHDGSRISTRKEFGEFLERRLGTARFAADQTERTALRLLKRKCGTDAGGQRQQAAPRQSPARRRLGAQRKVRRACVARGEPTEQRRTTHEAGINRLPSSPMKTPAVEQQHGRRQRRQPDHTAALSNAHRP